MLGSIPVAGLGGKFLFVTRKEQVGNIIKSVNTNHHVSDINKFVYPQLSNHDLFTLDTEVVCVITDTHKDDNDVKPFIDMAEEGYNLAFIFNSGTGAGDCPRGLSCISSDLGNIIVAGFEKTLKTEMPLYEKYSLEEFELLRQSLHERHIQVLPSIVIYVKIFFVKVVRDMKEYMETKGACNQCTKYLMRSVETKTALKVDELDVGFWTPAGPYLKDDLLPNVKGHFRGRTIPIGSVHVGFIVNFHLIIFVNISILLGKCSKKTEKEKLLVLLELSLRFWIKSAIR